MPRKRSVPSPDYEPELLGIPATGSFLMGGRANMLPPPSASKLAEQPAPIFERFSSSSEDTPVSFKSPLSGPMLCLHAVYLHRLGSLLPGSASPAAHHVLRWVQP